ncbi:MAG: HD domain-containing protein [Telmatospirillum sp.]|nr:HD domain-containing protein [Telmatospirillum sp.]
MTREAELLDIFGKRATARYGLAAVNQLQHALQSATLAERQGETPAKIVAALLHDVGHMVHPLGETPAVQGIDDRHEACGADWLAAQFGPAVSEPVLLHVAAKRFLVAAEPAYFARLSSDSIRSLELQGGAMDTTEQAAFRAQPYFEAAVRLRRIDEAAKDPNARTPEFTYFLREYVDRLAPRRTSENCA